MPRSVADRHGLPDAVWRTRSGPQRGCGHRWEILLGDGRLGGFRQNLQTRTHTITCAEPTNSIVLGSLGLSVARESVVHVSRRQEGGSTCRVGAET